MKATLDCNCSKTHSMKRIETSIPGACVFEPRVFGDARGFFLESYNQRVMTEMGISDAFVQDNHSYSSRGVVRGLHYQIQHPQGKLVRVAVGEILDVVVDLRRSSPTFGKWETITLSAENKRMLWIPMGLAHGFRVVSTDAHVLYKATDFYWPEFERTLLWSDRDLAIDWQLDGDPLVSPKDRAGVPFRDTDLFP